MNPIKLSLTLASASPRRHEILLTAGLSHNIITSDTDEGNIKFSPGEPGKYVTEISRLKNDAVYTARRDECGELILSADTIVYSPDTDEIFGKPKDSADATRMLRALSGKAHSVITGVTLRRTSDGEVLSFAEETKVYFRPLSDIEIEWYIKNYNPLDKAGAYGIQDGASVFVSRIDGDYFNVVGLPVCRVYKTLLEISKTNK